jgi:hypothetical protein
MLISCFDLFTFWYLCREAGLADLYSWLTVNPVHGSLGQRERGRERENCLTHKVAEGRKCGI